MPVASVAPLPREMQCAYRSKFCDAPRATKLDGTLHKLCDFHRRKANANQQRLHKRKKRILEQQAADGDFVIPQTPKTGIRAMKRARMSPDSPQSATAPVDGHTFQSNFDLLEVRILEVLLFGTDGACTQQPAQVTIKDENMFGPVSPTTPTMMTPVPVFDEAWSVTL
ncbi:hypothetical protein GN958_ATG18074 [Phytophthora infestans]|uniref:Uncharacterized protein n=1 Tax=Phytophthora infestans TaxID=4787 RepID=A0A8S9TVH0_PHYIN|nr:hypothetical protein GN958_ATG18074 [Phytophthora infestans]KAI9984687.1 hypothetical protein PInf_006051 [Phytophthora infestans]